jgi:Bacteriophage tail sheath protein
MSLSAAIPGLYYSTVRKAPEPSPLRTDVAGFLGRTQRGPVGKAIRVEGWREYVSVFGDLTPDALTPYALRGYFDNEGRVAHVIRLLDATQSRTAAARWDVGKFDGSTLGPDWPGAGGFRAIQFEVTAAAKWTSRRSGDGSTITHSADSPGDWADESAIDIRYWAQGPSGQPELELQIMPANQPTELLTGIHPASIVDEVNAQSAYVRLQASPLPSGLPPAALAVPLAPAGPRYLQWPRIRLTGGSSVPPEKEHYMAAVDSLGDEGEVALVVSPDLYTDLPNNADQIDVLAALLSQAEQLHDRLVLVDVPPPKPPQKADAIDAVTWAQSLRDLPQLQDEKILRNAAVYHPRLLVPDPLGGVSAPLRCVPCSGLVAGVISRLDSQRGAYFTPANAPINEAVDLSQSLDANGQALLYSGGINLLRCSPGRGLLVWGGRVLGTDAPGGYVAHRRLIHLLVRAIRQVAEPLVFDTNGPVLWLAFVRSITSVLLAAFRAGALKGDTPDQAFQVRCDANTNPPEQIEQGMVICEIKVAPAVPMEFITLRVAVSAQGQLEVFES